MYPGRFPIAHPTACDFADHWVLNKKKMFCGNAQNLELRFTLWNAMAFYFPGRPSSNRTTTPPGLHGCPLAHFSHS